MNFIRKKENFTCIHCLAKIQGTGYTNHCPKCLYSLHVDIIPGDRAEPCNGIMEPINFETEKGQYILLHQCQKCGAVKRNKIANNDNLDVLPKLSESIAKKTFF